jgi:membrane-bound ClpP family serine protease
MPSWDELQREIRSVPTAHDQVRRKYLAELSELTGRSTIVYYSAWNEKGHLEAQGLGNMFAVTDADKNGFMATIHELDRSKGLDLILHTPGGDVAAAESIVDYLRSMFGTDIRVIVPHLAMSAGTMISMSAKTIVMGKHSSLGPIDPQFGGVPAHGIIEEFETAKREIAADPTTVAVWQPIIAKYSPTVIGEAEKAVKWAEHITKAWLISGMFDGDPKAEEKASRIVGELSSHSLTLAHNRHYSPHAVRELGLRVELLEDEGELQEAVLTVHHSCILTLSETSALKIIENNRGAAHITAVQVAPQIPQFLPGPLMPTVAQPPAQSPMPTAEIE